MRRIFQIIILLVPFKILANDLPLFQFQKFANPVVTSNDNFQLIKSGTFTMGTPETAQGCMHNFRQHKVTLTRSYYFQITPVTQAQWYLVMGTLPSRNYPGYISGKDPCPASGFYFEKKHQWICPNHPVDTISWYDAGEFTHKLNKKIGLDCAINDNPHSLESYLKASATPGCYRLPTEAEWENAARGGTETLYSFGDDASLLGDYSWNKYNSGDSTREVGTKKPNLFGLYDTNGNIKQIVADTDARRNEGDMIDPLYWTNWTQVVTRGGYYFSDNICAGRPDYYGVEYRSGAAMYTGLRIVKTAE